MTSQTTWQPIFLMLLKSMMDAQLISLLIWVLKMELLQPYSLFSEMTQIAIDMCHNLETNALRLGGTS